ncbi:bifunctional riboflavin kinase/FAD synthetase [Streptomonospora sp. S1-112]|uniref:Riboflavin biosynthesis protein n=1 Tax=Streptomonospora mangrovi TaxID=2883123 RepID=A0A9X3NQ61_9ACTN|nr:bifunctional riboflavin kinase/FAD synthetase [Streptomonospora mangrovi]MDA0567847.1 bifunctional riboflavin kinase/FAD synthetase [Streptomonospora mangrovi]
MRPWHGLDEVPRDWGGSVVAIGVFDGVHRGHQAVLAAAAHRARALDLPVVAVVLDPHPDAARGGPAPAVLTPLDRRAALLAAHGAAAVCVLPVIPEPAAPEPEAFALRVLTGRLGAAAVAVGPGGLDLGGGGVLSPGDLRELGARHGFAVEVAEAVGGAEPVTSDRVRALLDAGDADAARAALGRPHRVEGVVVHGAARGRELLGFPTANLECPPGTAVPGDGVYAGRMLLTDPPPGAAETAWPAAISVGTNPTFEGAVRTVEGYALDRDDLDLYGRAMAMEFTHRIRGQLKFDSVEELIAAMGRDVDRARELAAEDPA